MLSLLSFAVVVLAVIIVIGKFSKPIGATLKAADKAAHATLVGIHKTLDEIENNLTDGKGYDEYIDKIINEKPKKKQ